jgi:ankyrin repeat protein
LEDIYGNQALWTAVFNAKGNYTVVEAFLKFKQDVEHKNKYGKSPLDFAKQITDQFLIKILENHKNLSYSGFN